MISEMEAYCRGISFNQLVKEKIEKSNLASLESQTKAQEIFNKTKCAFEQGKKKNEIPQDIIPNIAAYSAYTEALEKELAIIKQQTAHSRVASGTLSQEVRSILATLEKIINNADQIF